MICEPAKAVVPNAGARLRKFLLQWIRIDMKTTDYFRFIRQREDRAWILEEWIEQAIRNPLRREQQADGRVRLWASIPEADGRYLRVILLSDGETVHNAFFDRSFRP
jgi:hypothetical protein